VPIDQAAGAAAELGTARGVRARRFQLLGACHPAPAVSVSVLITVLAVASGRDTVGCLLVGAAVLTGQLSVGWSNDRVDLARDRRAGRGDKPLARGDVRPGTVSAAAVCALAACVPLSLASGVLAGTAHVAGVAAAWAYNLGLKRTVLSWLPYALGFGLLPAFVTLGLPGHPWPAAWVLTAGALIGVGAHATNVLPDIGDDLAAGVRGLPQRLGRRGARSLAACALLGASAALILGPPGAPGAVGWSAFGATGALSVAAVTLPATATRLPFLATIGVAAVDVGLLVVHGGTPV
jgi:4-hydroxybenzoate polyprenyltransferase